MSHFSRGYYDPNHPGYVRPEPVDAVFWCECGTPMSQDPEIEKKERAVGMCLLCIGERASSGKDD